MRRALTPDTAAAVVSAIARGASIEQAAREGGMAHDQIARWQRRGEAAIRAGNHSAVEARFAVGLAAARAARANAVVVGLAVGG